MSKGKWVAKEQPVIQRTVQVEVAPEVKQAVEATDTAVRTMTSNQPIHRAVILCLNLLLISARYGGIKRESEEEIVAAIASLE